MAMFVKVPQRDGSVHHKAVIRRKGHTTQSKTFPLKADAQKWARGIEKAMDDMDFHRPVRVVAGQLFKRFRDEVCPHRRGGRWETTRINSLLRETSWMQHPLSEVNADALQAWKVARCKEVSNATVNRELNLISGVFTHAIKEWRIKLPMNPVRGVNRPPPTKARNRRVSADELERIKGSRGAAGTIRWYLTVMFEFAIETALRLGELCALRWEDIHEDEGWLYVRPGKNGDDRRVPMSLRAVELLQELPKGVMLFPVNAGSFGTIFRSVCRDLGIVDLHFHDTRHEAVSRLAGKFPILQLAAIIGHRDLKSLQVYYNPTIQELTGYLRGAAPPTPQRL